VTDIDAVSGFLRVALARNGNAYLSGVSGLTFATGTEPQSAMSSAARSPRSNAALAGMTFLGDADYAGHASVYVGVSDQGNTGSGGRMSDSKSVSVTSAPVNECAGQCGSRAQGVDEDHAFGLLIRHAMRSSYRCRLQRRRCAADRADFDQRHVDAHSLAGLTFQPGDGNGDTSIVFTGSPSDIKIAARRLTFTPTANFNDAASVSIVARPGHTGSGGAKSDSDSVAITVNSVNDAPVNSVPNLRCCCEDQTISFSSAGGTAITVADLEATALRITLHATDGTLSSPTLWA